MKSHPNNTDRKKKFPITITNYHSNICCSVSSLLFPSDVSGASNFMVGTPKPNKKMGQPGYFPPNISLFPMLLHESLYCKNLQNIDKQFGKNIHEKLSFNLLSSTHCTYPILGNHIITK